MGIAYTEKNIHTIINVCVTLTYVTSKVCQGLYIVQSTASRDLSECQTINLGKT